MRVNPFLRDDEKPPEEPLTRPKLLVRPNLLLPRPRLDVKTKTYTPRKAREAPKKERPYVPTEEVSTPATGQETDYTIDADQLLKQASENEQTTNSNRLTVKQLEAVGILSGPERHVGLFGGSRSGKSVVIVRTQVIRGLKVGCRQAVVRLHGNAIWPSIGMDTFPFVMKHFFPSIRYKTNKSLGYITLLATDSELWLGGLDEKERAEKILGNEYASIFFNECSQIPYSSVLIALTRLAQKIEGLRQKAYYDLNPGGKGHWSNILFGEKKDPVYKRPLPNPQDYIRLQINPEHNKENLSPEYLDSLANLPERHRKRFQDGEYVDESDNALWNIDQLERLRVTSDEVPPLVRIVIAVDPSGAKNELDVTKDAIGIIAVGLGNDGHGYVLDDQTLLSGPQGWGQRAVSSFYYHKADMIIGEINFGGAMVEYVIRTIDASVPFKTVTASRGKVVRAEPISALYAKEMVHHVGRFYELEDEMQDFTDTGYIGERSPNRVDSLVWGLSELMLGEDASAWVEFYKNQAARMTRTVETVTTKNYRPTLTPNAHTKPIPDPIAKDMMAPGPYMNFYASGLDGRSKQYTSEGDSCIRQVEPNHIKSLQQAGCQLLSEV